MFKKRLTDEEIRERKEIKDMEITWSETFSMIIAFYKAIFPYVLILSVVFISLFFVSMWFLGGL